MKHNAKRVIYRFNGSDFGNEVELDLHGNIPVYGGGEIINRNGKRWKVVHVFLEESLSMPRIFPILTVSLSDRFPDSCIPSIA
jgi:hypothetical protein